ncbi:hypothetical protein DPMN_050695 [Dreissena polymorpha]|uniref:Uncharacterized protein n=1 Tax=Dreissena polymorpha TaxID=45954 RepID=A0A9D4CI13_DREPO|nr:hypothetical protein DPMN_050695 [Dreissena polymorpha]
MTDLADGAVILAKFEFTLFRLVGDQRRSNLWATSPTRSSGIVPSILQLLPRRRALSAWKGHCPVPKSILPSDFTLPPPPPP